MTRPEFEGQPAGIVTRSLACAVDMLVVAAVLVGVWAGATAVVFLSRPARFMVPSPSWGFTVAVSAVTSVLYLSTAWATTGRTYGAQLLGLRVLGPRQDRLGWPRSIARAAAYVVFPLGLAWAALDRGNRSLQDLVLGSRVVYDWMPHLLPQPGDGTLE